MCRFTGIYMIKSQLMISLPSFPIYKSSNEKFTETYSYKSVICEVCKESMYGEHTCTCCVK